MPSYMSRNSWTQNIGEDWVECWLKESICVKNHKFSLSPENRFMRARLIAWLRLFSLLFVPMPPHYGRKKHKFDSLHSTGRKSNYNGDISSSRDSFSFPIIYASIIANIQKIINYSIVDQIIYFIISQMRVFGNNDLTHYLFLERVLSFLDKE